MRYALEGKFDITERSGLERVRTILRKIKAIASPILRNFWIKELSIRTGLEEKVLLEEAESIGGGERAEIVAEKEAPRMESSRPLSRLELISERLVSFAAVTGNFAETETCQSYFPPKYVSAISILRTGAKKSDDPEIDHILETAFLQGESLPQDELENLKKELAREYFKELREHLARAIKAAEERGDEGAVRTALTKLQNIPNSL